MKLLVAGADRVDAGKTTFSIGLVDELGGTGFKPRGGNDYWFDHDDYLAAIEDGRLFGKDARRLAAASDAPVEPEEINPIHRLWLPTPRQPGILGQAHRQFIVDRVRNPETGTDHYVVNGTTEVPESAREDLPLHDAVVVEELDQFNDVMACCHTSVLEQFAERVRRADRAVVESYGDIANPVAGVGVDAVAVVEPTRVRFYDGERYQQACEAVGRSACGGQLEKRVTDVVEPLEPRVTMDLPALTRSERTEPERVRSAYGHAYDAGIALALE